ncbi:MAG: diacylglycerol kinase family lipid kinase, partial [Rhodospirillales bacterium]|nr:diacylglycerol kinase family lipid kinase [Rhodospirillales bacterium]
VNALAGSALPLAIVPMGTANVLAIEIGLRAEARLIAETALDGPIARIALGQVQGLGADHLPRRFTLMAGVGFDAEVVRTVDPRIKQRLGKLAYVLATLKLLLRYRTPRYIVHANGRQFAVGSVVLANGRHYGGAFVCAPDARLDRPSLELCLMQARGRRAIVRYALALALGRLHRQHDVEIVATREAMIEGPAGDPVQGDGDILGVLPARIAVAPETLLLAVPVSSPLLR